MKRKEVRQARGVIRGHPTGRKSRLWYVSETNFPGLVAEPETQQGLMEKIRLLIPELHDANRHLALTQSHDEEIVIQLTTMHRETIKLAAVRRLGVRAKKRLLAGNRRVAQQGHLRLAGSFRRRSGWLARPLGRPRTDAATPPDNVGAASG